MQIQAGFEKNSPSGAKKRAGLRLAWVGLAMVCVSLALTGCHTPVGADKTTPVLAYRQTHQNAVNRSKPSADTMSVLHRFDQVEQFESNPEATLQLIHVRALESRDRDLLFALSELNYLAGDRIRRSVKPWDSRDESDFYLASAVYAWFFLFGEAANPPPGPFDQRFRAACDLYNYSLGWALTQRAGTNAVAVLAGGTRSLPVGKIEIGLNLEHFQLPLADFESFVLGQQFLVRGLSLRNQQAGLGTTLVAVGKKDPGINLSRCSPATVLLRVDGKVSDLGKGGCRGSLELYSGYDTTAVSVGDHLVPLETDTTVPVAYGLNQNLMWRLGMLQFLSFEERIPTDVYLSQPYQPGKVPVVFVHGTFSSPVWWAEMMNTLSGDRELQKRCQFWYFIYNSGNPTFFSAVRLREALTAKIKELDPEQKDPALQQMVVIGHSQGGLLTKLTATDTGDQLLQALLKTNRLEQLNLTPKQEASLRHYTCFEALPSVRRVVFISTPHRGSYLANRLARRIARKIVRLPKQLVSASTDLVGITEKLDIPRELKGTPTSLDSMSPDNPVQLKLADIPLAPGIKGHSIIAVQGKGDYHKGKDGLVNYSSAHVDYVESELIVRGPHSCQGMPPSIEEVRRILHEHVSALPAGLTPQAKGTGGRQPQ